MSDFKALKAKVENSGFKVPDDYNGRDSLLAFAVLFLNLSPQELVEVARSTSSGEFARAADELTCGAFRSLVLLFTGDTCNAEIVTDLVSAWLDAENMSKVLAARMVWADLVNHAGKTPGRIAKDDAKHPNEKLISTCVKIVKELGGRHE